MPNIWSVLGFFYNGLFALRPHRDLVKEIAGQLRAGTPVLDAGCGTGQLANSASDRSQLVGVDWSASMLSRAARHRYGYGVGRADIAHLPFQTGVFGQVVSINVLYALEDPAAGLAELARVLRPGGQLLLATPVSSSLTPLLAEHFRVASLGDNVRLLLNLPRILAWVAVLTVRGLMRASTFTFQSEDRLRDLVIAAGFDIDSCVPCYAGIDRFILATKVVA